MNDLLTAMSAEMGINSFRSEAEDSFVYRLCYSALGQWCLLTAKNSSDGIVGTTKFNQTIVLNELLTRFSELFPYISDKFVDTSHQQVSFPVHIRRVYEETGYLLTDENNHNRIANFGRCIPIGERTLFFGIPDTTHNINGLGVFSNPTTFSVSAKEFLIRDDLTHEEYFRSRFDPIDFFEKDIDQNELEFFNPQSSNVPSQSWGKRYEVDCTVARKSEIGPFYRVMRIADTIQFADEPAELQSDSFTSYEYRRLYFALKAHYGKSLKATITKFDEVYSKIRLGGHLPNREYYLLLLMAWPESNAFDKVNFVIRNDFLPEAIAVLRNIGIDIGGGNTYA